MTYTIDIAGMKKDLPLCRVSDDLYIGAFVIFGDVEMTIHAAKELLKRMPETDFLIAPEAKSIPLIYEMSRQSGVKYLLARKKAKAYMSGVFQVSVQSITTFGMQTLVIDAADAEAMRGKRVVIIDDVISTGESLRATEELVKKAGGEIVAKWRSWRRATPSTAPTSPPWPSCPSSIPTAPSRSKKSGPASQLH